MRLFPSLQLALLAALVVLVSGCSTRDASLLPSFPASLPVGEAAAPVPLPSSLLPSDVIPPDQQNVPVTLSPDDNNIYAVYRFIYIDSNRTPYKVTNDLPYRTPSYTAIVPPPFKPAYPSVSGVLNIAGLSPGKHTISLSAYRLNIKKMQWDLSKYYIFTQEFTITEACQEGASACNGSTRIYCENGIEKTEECGFSCVDGACVGWIPCDDGVCDPDVDCNCIENGDCSEQQCNQAGGGGGTQETPTCSDGVQNQGETGIDCGGPCPACACQSPACDTKPSLWVVPSKTTLSAGETFNVVIYSANLNNVVGLNPIITFDSSVVQIVSTAKPSMPSVADGSFFCLKQKRSEGRYEIACAVLDSNNAISGTKPAVSLTFNAIQAGTSDIRIEAPTVNSFRISNGITTPYTITVEEVHNATVNVGSGGGAGGTAPAPQPRSGGGSGSGSSHSQGAA